MISVVVFYKIEYDVYLNLYSKVRGVKTKLKPQNKNGVFFTWRDMSMNNEKVF